MQATNDRRGVALRDRTYELVERDTQLKAREREQFLQCIAQDAAHRFQTAHHVQHLPSRDDIDPRLHDQATRIHDLVTVELQKRPPSGYISARSLENRLLVDPLSLSALQRYEMARTEVLGANFFGGLEERSSAILRSYSQHEVFLTADERPPGTVLLERIEESGIPRTKELDPAGGTKQLVKYFNAHLELRGVLRPIILEQIELNFQRFWNYSGGTATIVRPSEAAAGRSMMLAFFECNDPQVKEQAIRKLIDLIEGDPIDNDSALNLAKLQKDLFRHVSIDSMQNLSVGLQSLLIRAFALNLELILLHTGSSLNALDQMLKDELWDGAEHVENMNIAKNAEIAFWGKYALQAAQRIKSDETDIEQFLRRIGKISCAAVIVTNAAVSQTITPEEIYSIFEEIQGALSHLPWKESWFERLLSIKRLFHASMHSAEHFMGALKIVGFLREKGEGSVKTDQRVYYGLICALESALEHSNNLQVMEQGLKTLITLFSLPQEHLKERTVCALNNLYRSGRPLLQVVSYEILELLRIKANAKLDDIIVKALSDLEGKRISYEELSGHEKRLTQNVLKFLVRDIGEIRSESSDLSLGIAAAAMLCETVEEQVYGQPSLVTKLLDAIYKLRPDSFQPDSQGRTLLHIAVAHKHTHLLYAVHPSRYGIDPQAMSLHGDRALTLAVKEGLADAVEPLLLLGADATLGDAKGNTVLHLLAKNHCNDSEATALLEALLPLDEPLVIDSTRSVSKFSGDDFVVIDQRNHQGKSALLIALEESNREKTRLFLRAGASLHQCDAEGTRPLDHLLSHNWTDVLDEVIEARPELMSPLSPVDSLIIAAAHRGADQSLAHLLSKSKQLLSQEELYAMTQMIYRHIGCLNVIGHFAAYHCEQIQSNPSYRKQLASLRGINLEHKAPSSTSEEKEDDEDAEEVGAFGRESCYVLVASNGVVLTKENLGRILCDHGEDLAPSERQNIESWRLNIGITRPMLLAFNRSDFRMASPSLSPEELHAVTMFGKNALYYGVLSGNVEGCRFLLEKEVTPLWPQSFPNIGQGCAFSLACEQLQEELLDLFFEDALARGVNLGQKDLHGHPCWLAAFIPALVSKDNHEPMGHEHSGDALARREELSSVDRDRILEKLTKTLEQLRRDRVIEKDVGDYCDELGRSALHLVCIHGEDAPIPTLLRLYPDLFWKRDAQGRIPLQVAYEQQRYGLVRTLVTAMSILLNDLQHIDLYHLRSTLRKKSPGLDLEKILTSDRSLNDLFFSYYQQIWRRHEQAQEYAVLERSSRERLSTLVEEESPDLMEHSSTSQSSPLRINEESAFRGNAMHQTIRVAYQRLFQERENTPLHIAAQEGFVNLFMEHLDSPTMLLSQNNEGNTPLHLAALYGHYDCMEEILMTASTRGDTYSLLNLIERANDHQQTALHLCAVKASPEHLKCFELLLKQGASPLVKDGEGNNCAHYVCKYGSLEMVELLLSYSGQSEGAIDSPEEFDATTPTELSSRGGFTPGVGTIRLEQTNLEEIARGGILWDGLGEGVERTRRSTPWRSFFPPSVAALSPLELKQKLWSSPNDHKRPPAMLATLNGHLHLLRRLYVLDQMSPLSERIDSERTLCHFQERDLFGYDHVRLAVLSGQQEVLLFLIDEVHLPYRNLCDQSETALHAACYNGFSECLEVLLAHDASSNHERETLMIHQRDLRGETPAHEVWKRHPSYHKFPKKLHVEEEAGRSHRIVDSSSSSLVHSSYSPGRNRHSARRAPFGRSIISQREVYQRVRTLELLHQYGADFGAQDLLGRTPWHAMCRFDFRAIVDQLPDDMREIIRKKINIQDTHGRTAAHIAARSGLRPMLEYLSDQRAALDRKDEIGYTPSLLAAESKAFPCIDFLLEHQIDLSATLRPKANYLLRQGKRATILTLLIDTGDLTPLARQLFIRIRQRHPKLLSALLTDQSNIFHLIAAHGHEGLLDETLPFMPATKATRRLLTQKNQIGKSPLDICTEHGRNELRHRMETYSAIGSRIQENGMNDCCLPHWS